MNLVFLLLVSLAYLAGCYEFITGETTDTHIMQKIAEGMVTSANGAVTLSIGLVGVMTLFLGLMKIGEEGGLLKIISKVMRPLLQRLFEDVPPNHPAMGAMVLNLSANALGLANAATPFGIKAMNELNRLNKTPGVATNAMVLFLAINASSITLLPTGVIALRAAAGSADPAGILPTTLFATAISTCIAIVSAKCLARFFPIQAAAMIPIASEESAPSATADDSNEAYPLWISYTCILAILAFIPFTVYFGKSISPWILPTLMLGLMVFGVVKKVRIYEAFIEGAKEGFQVAVKIVPYLVAILVSVEMLKVSGALPAIVNALSHVTTPLGLPAEALPMALLRPLSGSGAFGVLASTINDPHIGPDSYVGYLVSTLQGTSETTFYVLAVYFGAVQVKKIRHALWAALLSDVAGVVAAVYIVRKLYGD